MFKIKIFDLAISNDQCKKKKNVNGVVWIKSSWHRGKRESNNKKVIYVQQTYMLEWKLIMNIYIYFQCFYISSTLIMSMVPLFIIYRDPKEYDQFINIR